MLKRPFCVKFENLVVVKRVEAVVVEQSMQMSEKLQRQQVYRVIEGRRELLTGLVHFIFCLHKKTCSID